MPRRTARSEADAGARHVEGILSEVAEGEPAAETSPPNPEAAADALGQISFEVEGGAPANTPEPPPPSPEPRKIRRTKAETEAENQRLAAEVERLKAERAKNAPDVVAAMKAPLKLTFRAAAGVMASWKGPHWNLSEQESNDLAEAWAPCVGPLLSAYPEAVIWAAALGVTYAIAYPRLAIDKQNLALEVAAPKGDAT